MRGAGGCDAAAGQRATKPAARTTNANRYLAALAAARIQRKFMTSYPQENCASAPVISPSRRTRTRPVYRPRRPALTGHGRGGLQAGRVLLAHAKAVP